MNIESYLYQNHINAKELFLYSLVTKTMIHEDETSSEVKQGLIIPDLEMLAFRLIPFFSLVGAWKNLEATQVEEVLAYIHKQVVPGFDPEKISDQLSFFIQSIVDNTRIVRGHGYPEQTLLLIEKILLPFDSEFYTFTGVKVSSCLAIAKATLCIIEDNLNDFRQSIDEEINKKYTVEHLQDSSLEHEVSSFFLNLLIRGLSEKVPARFEQILDATGLEYSELEAFLKIFAMNRNHSSIDVFEKAQMYQAIEFDESLAIISFNSMLDAIMYCFDQRAKQSSFYNQYQFTRGAILEDMVANCFEHFFPGHVLRSLVYYLDTERKSSAEIDMIIFFEPYIFLVEAKSGQYRFESQLGNIGRLKTDLKNNILEAYDQAVRAKNYIQNNDSPKFYSKEGVEVALVNKEKFDKVFLCTVSLNHFSTVATRLSNLESAGIFRFQHDLPWALSFVELDLIRRFLSKRSYFLHYLTKRLEVQRRDVLLMSDESDYLGMYITHRLSEKNIFHGDKGIDSADFMLAIGQSEVIDQAMGAYGHEKNPSLDLKMPSNMKWLICILDEMLPDKTVLSVIFKLLDQPDRVIDKMDDAIGKILNESYIKNNFKRCNLIHGDTIFVLVAAIDRSDEDLMKYLNETLELEKYRSRAFHALGFAFRPKNLECKLLDFSLLQGKHQINQELEMKSAIMAGRNYVGRATQVGRNDLCPCESGKKFKKCHGR